jgi:hypothetical protein
LNIEALKAFGDRMSLISFTSWDEMKDKYRNKYYTHSLNYWLDKYNETKSNEIMEFIKSKEWLFDRLMNDYLYKLDGNNERIVPTN